MNGSGNGEESMSASFHVKFFYFFLFGITAVLGLCGNAFVMYVICSNRKFRQCAMNVILVNLAVADTLNIISCIPDLIINLAPVIPYPFPEGICKLTRYAQCVAIFASVLMQLTVCFERFFAICHPMIARVHQSWSKVTFALASAWSIALAAATPYIANTKISTVHQGNQTNQICDVDARWHLHYQLAELIFFYVTPGFTFIVVYSLVSATLWRASRSQTDGCSSEVRISLTNGNKNSESVISKRKKVIRTLIACVLVYLTCYSPTNFLFFYFYVQRERIGLPFAVNMVFNWMPYMSGAANPVIYVICMPVFRQKLFQMFCCKSRTTHSALNGWELQTRFKTCDTKTGNIGNV